MGNELPLARQASEGYAELLVRISSGVSRAKPSSRDKREKVTTTSRGHKVEAATNTTPKSKGSIEAKGADVRRPGRPKGHRRDNKDRKQDRGDEGEDTSTRWSAQLLGITFPGSYCDDTSTRLSPHYWIEVDKISVGSMFQCARCYNYLWLPGISSDAEKLGNLMRQFGSNEGYCRFLNHASRRPAKIMLAKLQRLYKLSSDVVDSLQFGKEVDKILSDRRYDKHGQELSCNIH